MPIESLPTMHFVSLTSFAVQRMIRRSVCLLFALALSIGAAERLSAAQIDTLSTFSKAMNKKIPAIVITPERYKSGSDRFSVVYLLHGFGGSFAAWLKEMPEVTEYADRHNVILVCADGNIGSWYFDSPIDPAWKYETYISSELVSQIDQKYRTIADRKGRGVTGYSMGGHGAMYVAFKHQDVFGVAGSMSGGVDFRPFPGNWDIAKRLGPYAQNTAVWDQYTVTNMINLLKPRSLELIIDCGTADFFAEVNQKFHERLLAAGIGHDYIVRPGAHNWPYWRNALDYQLLFMERYFKRK